MSGHLVLIGGGHAHLATISRIDEFVAKGHRVSVISPSSHHYYSGMSPGALSGTYRSQEIRFNIKKMVEGRGGSFVYDKVIFLDPHRKELMLDSGGGISYDIASFNVGSRVSSGSIYAGNRSVFPVKPIVNLVRSRKAVDRVLKQVGGEPGITVIGGGPAGVEIAAALATLADNASSKTAIRIITGGKILGPYPSRARELVIASLSRRGVHISEDTTVKHIEGNNIELEDGNILSTDIIFLAMGVKPSPLFLNTLLPTGEDGGLLVNSFLQSVQYDNIFGGGDCITIKGMPLDRVGVYAVRQNPILSHNLLAALEGDPLNKFDPGPRNYLQILNMGDGTGIFRKGNWVWQGRLAFIIKDRIDRRFMKKFQVSGELDEPE
ncbi:MAG: NAD(P)/FAD-dependent oxidoreductase [bacterium]